MNRYCVMMVMMVMLGCSTVENASDSGETGEAVARGATTEVCALHDGSAARLVEDEVGCSEREKHVCWAGNFAPAPATHACSSMDGLDVVLVDPPGLCDAAHPKHVCDASK